ncbi:hypothetical protein M3202_01565 [Alkalihalobacillus oceani]|uniref:Uncharacterized protein n=1 Tax=Halalkalibacter oceani TaxID=1653776 RepID=A0A9X2DM93_9BACI|nr:hypothetical protein [Halalkalibacter oceani]MCM3712757.1 hypothetical protein [Halalkalibacter oceani]
MMKHNESELSALLKYFDKLLQEYPDEANSFFAYKNFLKILVDHPDYSRLWPAAEVVTVIAHKKPHLFNLLKKQSSDRTYFYFLQAKDRDYDQAEKRLSHFKALQKDKNPIC